MIVKSTSFAAADSACRMALLFNVWTLLILAAAATASPFALDKVPTELVPVKAFQVQLSEMTCNVTGNLNTTMCLMKNVFYWKKQFYFVTPEPRRAVLYQPSFTFPADTPMPEGLVKAVSPAQMADILHDQKFLIRITQGIARYRWCPWNIYHAIWEVASNSHMLACQFFGKCEYDPFETDVQVFYVDPQRSDQYVHVRAEQCVTRRPHVSVHEKPPKVPMLVEQLTYGLGPSSFREYYHFKLRQQAPVDIRLSWYHRLRSCMGLTKWSRDVSELTEQIVTINRRALAKNGRDIANIDEVISWVHDALPGFKVEVQHFENKTMEEQAAIWDRSTVVISTHGAQLSNAFYLPNNSVIIEIDQMLRYFHDYYKRLVIDEGKPFLNVQHFNVIPTSWKTVHISKPMNGSKWFRDMAEWKQRAWVNRPRCDHGWMNSDDRQICRRVWLKYYTDIIVDKMAFTRALRKTRAWLEQQGLFKEDTF